VLVITSRRCDARHRTEELAGYTRRIGSIFKEVTIMSSKDDLVTPDTQNPAFEEIALRAYGLWEKRGCPIGSPEEDWFRAEEEIRSLISSFISRHARHLLEMTGWIAKAPTVVAASEWVPLP
jgi:Protein of unknown function (DUF2934)